jgi:glycosyltransferase involved in cell wall biosynthesis
MILIVVMPKMEGHFDDFLVFKSLSKLYKMTVIISRGIKKDFFGKTVKVYDFGDCNNFAFISKTRKIIKEVAHENKNEKIIVHSHIFNWPIFLREKNVFLVTSFVSSSIKSFLSAHTFAIVSKGMEIKTVAKVTKKNFANFALAVFSMLTSKGIITNTPTDRHFYFRRNFLAQPGIDTVFFSPTSLKKTKKIIFVGSLEYNKGVFKLFEIIESLGKKHCFTIIGENKFGDKKIDERLTELKKKYCIEHFKKIDRQGILQKYNESFILLSLSNFEGVSRALKEALSCGLFCISTNIPGHKLLKSGFQNLFIIENNDSKEFVKKIEEIFNEKKEKQTIKDNVVSIQEATKSFDKAYKWFLNEK